MIEIVVGLGRPAMSVGVEAACASAPDCACIAQLRLPSELMKLAADRTAALIVTDLDFLRPDGVATLAALAHLSARVLVLGDSSADVELLIRSGARGVMRDTAELAEILGAIRRVAGGDLVARGDAFIVRRGSADAAPPLTERELEVLEWVVRGATNAQIATALYIALTTVKTHLSSIYTKLDVSGRPAAAAVAVRRGLVAADRGDRLAAPVRATAAAATQRFTSSPGPLRD